MTVDKLSRFASLPSPLSQDPQIRTFTGAQRSEQGASVSAQGDEAVRVGTSVSDSGDSANAAKVARLREQVAQGSYRPDSTKVAEALVRDLFA